MEVNETRNCPVTDILKKKKSENRLNGFENGKTWLFNSGGVVKWAYFQKKKWSIPLRTRPPPQTGVSFRSHGELSHDIILL